MNDTIKDKDTKMDEVRGTVIEALPNAMFRIKFEEPQKIGDEVLEDILGYLAGKMRMHRIRVLVGDTVLVKLDPYGGKARIFKRL